MTNASYLLTIYYNVFQGRLIKKLGVTFSQISTKKSIDSSDSPYYDKLKNYIKLTNSEWKNFIVLNYLWIILLDMLLGFFPLI